MSTGSDLDQINLIQISSTLMEIDMMNVTLRKAAFITSRRTLAPLMLGLITVLWPRVGRYYLEMEPNWIFKVSLFCIWKIWTFECQITQ